MHPFIDRNSKVLLDSNLLTIFLVAQLGAGEIERNKKTRNFTSEDAQILQAILEQFEAVITTPHILAEVTNLLDWVTGEKRLLLFNLLANFIQQVDEKYLSAKHITFSPAFIKLGLTDACLFELIQQEKTVLLTADLALYGFAVGYHLPAINFNHLRNL